MTEEERKAIIPEKHPGRVYSLLYSLQDSQIILVSMQLVYLLSLSKVFAYFLRTTRTQGKSSMNQNDVICFKSAQ